MIQDKLKKHRNEIGISQKDISEQLGITQQSYSNWEAGKAQPSPENLKKIAKIFGVSPGYLLGWEDENKTDRITVLINKLIEKTQESKIRWISPTSDNDFKDCDSSQIQRINFIEDRYELQKLYNDNEFMFYYCLFAENAYILAYNFEASKIALYGGFVRSVEENNIVYISLGYRDKLQELQEAITQSYTDTKYKTIDKLISDLDELDNL